MLRDEEGELVDKKHRLVNKRGYLVERAGNVVNQNGEIIFKAEWLDDDDEIPAPYAFEKRRENLMHLPKKQDFNVPTHGKGESPLTKGDLDTDNEEDFVEREFNRIRYQGTSYMPSQDSGSQLGLPQRQSNNLQPLDSENLDETMVDLITRKTQPMGKNLHHRVERDNRISSATVKQQNRLSSNKPIQRAGNSSVAPYL
jgi:hypothetical protein